jgi:hypothetical protein
LNSEGKGVVVVGFGFPASKLDFEPDIHIHLKVLKRTLIANRKKYLESHPDDPFNKVGDEVEEMLAKYHNTISYQHFLKVMKDKKIDIFTIDSKELDEDGVKEYAFARIIKNTKDWIKDNAPKPKMSRQSDKEDSDEEESDEEESDKEDSDEEDSDEEESDKQPMMQQPMMQHQMQHQMQQQMQQPMQQPMMQRSMMQQPMMQQPMQQQMQQPMMQRSMMQQPMQQMSHMANSQEQPVMTHQMSHLQNANSNPMMQQMSYRPISQPMVPRPRVRQPSTYRLTDPMAYPQNHTIPAGQVSQQTIDKHLKDPVYDDYSHNKRKRYDFNAEGVDYPMSYEEQYGNQDIDSNEFTNLDEPPSDSDEEYIDNKLLEDSDSSNSGSDSSVESRFIGTVRN